MKNRAISVFTIVLILLFVACKQTRNDRNSPNNSIDFESNELFHIPYTSSEQLDNPVLVLILHGDAPFSQAFLSISDG